MKDFIKLKKDVKFHSTSKPMIKKVKNTNFGMYKKIKGGMK